MSAAGQWSALTSEFGLYMTGLVPVLTGVGVAYATWLLWRWGGDWLESRRLATKRRDKKERCRLALEQLQRRVEASDVSDVNSQ